MRWTADWGDDRLPSRRDPAALTDRAGRRYRRLRNGGGGAVHVDARHLRSRRRCHHRRRRRRRRSCRPHPSCPAAAPAPEIVTRAALFATATGGDGRQRNSNGKALGVGPIIIIRGRPRYAPYTAKKSCAALSQESASRGRGAKSGAGGSGQAAGTLKVQSKVEHLTRIAYILDFFKAWHQLEAVNL